jgi:hypothetical protein
VNKLVQLIWLILLFFIKISSVEAQPYFGLNLGVSVLTGRTNLNFDNTNSRVNGNSYGFRAQLLLGYNFHPFTWKIFLKDNCPPNNFLRKFFFALELDSNYNTNRSSASIRPLLGTNASISVKNNWGFDLFFLGKYQQARNVNFFFGPGVSWGYFQTSSSRRTIESLSTSRISRSSNTWLLGWSIKTGVEVAWQFMSIVTTYQFTSFNRKTVSRSQPLTGNSITARYRPKVNSITIGLNINDFTRLFSGNSCCPTCVEEVDYPVRNDPPQPSKVVIRQSPPRPSYAGPSPSDVDRRYPASFGPPAQDYQTFQFNPEYGDNRQELAMNIDSDLDNAFAYSY